MTATKIILSLLVIGILSFCIWRDILLEKQYPGDLRNRIVGSRLQKDGRLPYYYKWQPQDGLRYYDPQNFDTLRVSNMTGTPFLHTLMTPIAEQEQRSISRIWLIIEYALLFFIMMIALSFARNNIQKWAMVGMTILFMLTAGWQAHIAAGQYYIIMPALFILFYYFTSRRKLPVHAFVAGFLAACIVLIRPNTAPFFLPFFFLWIRFSLKYKLAFAVPVLLVLTLAFGSGQSRGLWSEYRAAVSEQVKAHQGHPVTQQNTPDPQFAQWEGWDKGQRERDARTQVFNFEPGHGNLLATIKRIVNVHLPVWLFMTVSFIFMLALVFIFYKKKVRSNSISLFAVTLLGFSLYMISDLSAPFYRYQYNAVQWIFPLLLIIIYYHRRYKYIYLLIVAGLLLNIIEIRPVPFEHPAGEYLILTGLLLLSFMYTPESQAKKTYIYPHA